MHTSFSLFLLLLIASLTLIHIPKSFCQDQRYVICGQPFRCANKNFNYPFWGGDRPSDCGYPGFNLSCQNDVAILAFESLRYRVVAVDSKIYGLRLARDDLWDNLCPGIIYDTTVNSSIFTYSTYGFRNVTLSYGCNFSAPVPQPFNQFGCEGNYSTPFATSFYSIWAVNRAPAMCYRSITVPVYEGKTGYFRNSTALRVALQDGFGLQWDANNSKCEECSRSGGRCGYNSSSNSFLCFCTDWPHDLACNDTQTGNDHALKQGFGLQWGTNYSSCEKCISLGTTGLILSVAGIAFFLLKRCSSGKGIIWPKSNEESSHKIEAFMRSYGNFAPKCYNFTQIKRMTNSFAHLLGQGGYGSVYKGTLPDGRIVAVKVLKDNRGNGEEFINEVASISRTSHVNVVTLLGFCYKANTRALVYEFMPNGSLDKFIQKNGSKEDADCRLEWRALYQITLGTARGLDYLHQDFCPKISDFGLAKLCKQKESVLSTMGARGTVGYIAPEVFFRGFGGISHKSDVYSYGMMILEMVGLKGRVQVDTDKSSSETYFPNWIYERLELEKELGFEGVKNAEDEEGARKMILVGLWCIQTKPSDRPSMSKVVEMLEGSMQSLQIPPKPYLLESPAAMRSLEESSSETSLS
ncbi:hypothetical protein M9H77_05531 [Catharanthus roseus]|uniref:Uncharacterized protein n=1 Tax=Catharanthus roseus TaxID=4058 RepID=A0ACC0CHM2_CATRO|nr:hypothetical protein M9H77_05531 [Catharanthus roseus]